MESECNCPACLKTFSETNQLPCGHVFCPDCVSQTEKRAQKTRQSPTCPICLVPFAPATEETPHPNSKYHDELVSLLAPAEGNPPCKDCENEAEFECQNGCGVYCEDCKADHLKPKRKTASHKFITLLESASSRKVNPRNCIIHNQQIIRVCLCCWPIAEMCSTCALADAETNPGHSRIDVSKITYETIKEDEMIEKLQRKITVVQEKNMEASAELARITKEEEKELESINQFHDDIVQKAGRLKDALTDLTKSLFRLKLDKAETYRGQTEVTENILKHSVQVLTESKELYKKGEIITKLKKSAVLSEIVAKIEISDITPASFDDIKSIVSLDKNEGKPSKCQKLIESLVNGLEKTQRGIFSLQEKHSNVMRAIEDVVHPKVVIARQWRFNTEDYKPLKKVGTYGSEPLKFNKPWAIATHPKSGSIYVTDAGNHRVQVFNEDMEFITTFGSEGSGKGEFEGPVSISISLNGLIAVGEVEGDRVQIFDETHSVVATISKGQKKSAKCKQASDYAGLKKISSLCFDAEDNLFVVKNLKEPCIDKFNSDFEFECSFGRLHMLAELGILSLEDFDQLFCSEDERKFDEKKPQVPFSIFLTSKNELCVATVRDSSEPIGNKLVFYATNGKYIRDVKVDDYKAPFITEGPNSTILLSDPENNIVRFCDMETGETVHTLNAKHVRSDDEEEQEDEEEEDKTEDEFNEPAGTCFGLNQKLYVCDREINRIQVFSAE